MDNRLIQLNHQGLIPGPQESETDFLTRANYCFSLQDNLFNELGKNLPFSPNELSAPEILQAGIDITKTEYDIAPTWIPLFFSNLKLTPWHGGCAWIFQVSANSPLGALLQLRQTFRTSKKYLGLYHRDELIAHELTHTARMAYNEPKFEEFFSYGTSESKFRRWFGPIVQSAKESYYFVLMLLLTFMAELSIISSGHYEYYSIVAWVKIIPIGMIIYALWRLWQRHSTLLHTYENLNAILQDDLKARAVIFRLTDDEIIAFKKMSKDEILDYVQRQSELRWKVIKEGYFKTFSAA